MADTTLQSQLARIQFLLVLGVSLLSGLVFGRDHGGEAFFAIVSFLALGLVVLLTAQLQS